MRTEMIEEQRRFDEQARLAAEAQLRAHTDRLERLRSALVQLDDDLIELLSFGGPAAQDLVTDALAPIIAKRAERRSVLAAAETAAERLPAAKGEIKRLERELESLRKDPDVHEWVKGQRGAHIDQELATLRERVEMFEAEVAAARKLK
jgi:hypothetical protein